MSNVPPTHIDVCRRIWLTSSGRPQNLLNVFLIYSYRIMAYWQHLKKQKTTIISDISSRAVTSPPIASSVCSCLILSSSSVNIFCLRILSPRRRNLKANVRIYFKIRDRLNNKKTKQQQQQQLQIFRHVPSRSQGEKNKMCLDGENKFRVC